MSKAAPSSQMVLLPEGPVTLAYTRHLTAAELIVGPGTPPTKALVDSIGRLGVLQPIVVRQNRDGRFEVVDGRRRVLCARHHGQHFVPGLIAEGLPEGVAPASLLLLLNEQRRSNPLAELAAIEALVAAGATEADIARETGLAAATIRQRFKLTGAHPTLRAMAAAGELALGVLEQAASLTPQQQVQLLDDATTEDGSARITSAMVHELKQARTQAAVAALPAALFEVPSLDTPSMDEATIRADERERIAVWLETAKHSRKNPPLQLIADAIRRGDYAAALEAAS